MPPSNLHIRSPLFFLFFHHQNCNNTSSTAVAQDKITLKQFNVDQTTLLTETPSRNETTSGVQEDPHVLGVESSQFDQSASALDSRIDEGQRGVRAYDVFLLLAQSDLHNLCGLLGHEGLSDKVYTLAGDVLKKLASAAAAHQKNFILELSELVQRLSSLAVNELITLRETHMLGLSAGSMAGAAILRVLQILSSFTSVASETGKDKVYSEEQEEHATMWKLNVLLEFLWKQLSECISTMES